MLGQAARSLNQGFQYKARLASKPSPPSATMLRRRRRRSSSTSACFLSLFVVVILLLLPAGVAATSKKQSLLNWFKRTFQGGEEDLEADKALESEAAAAVDSLTALINGTSQPPPPPGAEPPPLLLDQVRELFAALGLPPSSLAHLNDLKVEDITMVCQTVLHAPYKRQCRGDSALGLTCSCHHTTIHTGPFRHHAWQNCAPTNRKNNSRRRGTPHWSRHLALCLRHMSRHSAHSNQPTPLGNHAGTHKGR